jgi:streptogramin lyase
MAGVRRAYRLTVLNARKGEVTMTRSLKRSLVVSAFTVFAFLVSSGVSSAQTFPLPPSNPPCTVAPSPAPPGTTCQPAGITTGPDANVWFTEENGDKIGRITPGGAITEFPLPSGSHPTEITPAPPPEQALYFTESGTNSIGRITTAGAITRRSVGGSPDGITTGPDGNLWFTEPTQNRIGRIPPVSGTHTYFSGGLSEPGDITAGPDGRLWFTQSAAGGPGGRIGAITPGSSTFSHFPSPSGGLSDPSGITSSAGAIWFTEAGAGTVRRVDTAGVIGAPIPVGPAPSAIATGADAALWFTEEGAGKIGRVTASGVLTNEFPVSRPDAAPAGITAGPDGALWYTEQAGNAIGRIATSTGGGGGGGGTLPPPPKPPAPPAGKQTAKKCKVPKLRGLTVKKARKKLKKARCKFKFRGKGKVVSTNPKAGRSTTKRVTVKCKRGARR